MTARATWKKSEARLAALIGGTRVPVSGRARGDAPDIEHPRFAVECKFGRVLGTRLLLGIAQAEAAAEKSGKTPLVLVEQTAGQGRPNRRYALLRLDDFIELLGGATERSGMAG